MTDFLDELTPGTIVTFKGGTGRNDEDQIRVGIINGELVQMTDGMVYVPVHVQSMNHNIAVAEQNITGVQK
jgi:hypothetical protein